MRAVQYTRHGGPVEINEVPTPTPGPGQVLLRVLAAGLCHSDEFIMGLPEEVYLQRYPFPLTMGHEAAGVIEAVGSGVSEVAPGQNYLVYGPWGCGVCAPCRRGEENYCANGPVMRRPGAMADFMLVDAVRHLVPLSELDPIEFVSLTDAALTPYHAIMQSKGRLGAGATAVVIGVGGLGHVAIQLLRALTPARIIAVDLDNPKLELAVASGAHHALQSDEASPAAFRDLTHGAGASVVLDFVGIESTLALAAKITGMQGEIAIVGLGGGVLPVGSAGYDQVARGVRVSSPYWGSTSELGEVVELARSGLLHIRTEQFALENAAEAFRRLRTRELAGRAVIVPAL